MSTTLRTRPDPGPVSRKSIPGKLVRGNLIQGLETCGPVLIVGCGDVGSTLGVMLAAQGCKVYGLRRNPSRLPAELLAIAADFSDPGSLCALPRDIRTVFYTAASDGRSEDAYRLAYCNGLENILAAMREQDIRPRRLLFTSSTSVYGQRDGEWVDENSATEPAGFAGRVILEAERIVHESGIPAAAVRFGGIYGPGRGWLTRTVREGAPCIAEPPLYTNRIHRDDCAGVLAHIGALGSCAPVYVAVDCDPAPQCEVMRWIAERLGVPEPKRMNAQDVPGSRGSKRCRNAALLETGYEFLYPTFREGYGGLIEPQPQREPDAAG